MTDGGEFQTILKIEVKLALFKIVVLRPGTLNGLILKNPRKQYTSLPRYPAEVSCRGILPRYLNQLRHPNRV